MSNYETARLVRSVVSERDLVPVMTHFHLYTNRIQGSNGKMTLDAPWDIMNFGEPVNFPAEAFARAFENMPDPKLEMKDAHLIIKQAKMRVRIPASREPYPRAKRPDKFEKIAPGLLEGCRKIRPFVSADASRPWACAILYRDGWLYATNNIVLVRTKWDGGDTEFELPSFAVDQLIRCGRTLSGMAITENEIAYDLGDDVWFQSLRYQEEWPKVETMLEYDFKALPKTPDGLAGAVRKILPFCPDKRHPIIRFMGDKIATLEGEMQAEIEIEIGQGAFHAEPLLLVLEHAARMESRHPKPSPFANHDLTVEGILSGVRL